GTNTQQAASAGNRTSAAPSLVAGTAALMRAVVPTLSNGVIVNRIARSADPAGTQSQTGNGRVNIARALADTSTDSIQPAGNTANGGPFVGPYGGAANAISGSLQGQNNPACVSPSPCPWQTTNMTGWAELQTVPLRLYFDPGQNGNGAKQFTISIDHAAGKTQGLDGLINWSLSSNVTGQGGLPTGTSTGGVTCLP